MTGYHVAPAQARETIEQLGLLAGGPNPRWSKYGVGEQPPGVYFWDTFDRALQWAADFGKLIRDPELGACDIWRVKVTGAHVDPVLGHQGARYWPGSLPPARISLAVRA